MNNWYVVMGFSAGRDDDHQEWKRYYGPYSKEEASSITSEIENSPEMDDKTVQKYPFCVWVEDPRQISSKTSAEIILLLRDQIRNFR